jgi:hypothetical protein
MDSLVTTSSFAAQEQRLTTKVYSFDNFHMFDVSLTSLTVKTDVVTSESSTV